MKKVSVIVGTVVSSIVIITAVFAIERPVMYYREFLPVAADVIELVAENTHAAWVRADEQVERRKAKISRAGGKATPEERAALRRWKATLFELERKLDRLKPKRK